ncbi:MAG: PepSY domain-containing protein [Gemmatimonadaceae bacterium]
MQHRIMYVALVTLAIGTLPAAARAQQAAPSRASGHTPKEETPAQLRAAAKVSEAAARATALAAVPGSTVESSELEREKGALIWSFDLKRAGKPGIEEVAVDAVTGAIVAREHESPAAEEREVARERKARGGAPKAAHPSTH